MNSVTDVTIRDNIFFNDFAGSGRTNNNDTGSFIVVKDSNAGDDEQIGSERITVRRNVFLKSSAICPRWPTPSASTGKGRTR